MTQSGADLAWAAELAALAGLLADNTRAAICVALLDGRAWTVTELAKHAGVATSTASEHVTRLVNGAVLDGVRQGRQRYVRLADPAIAQVLEDMLALDRPAAGTHLVRSLREARASAAVKRARTCYDHLAGLLGVQVTDALIKDGVIEQYPEFWLTADGTDWLGEHLGIDVPVLFKSRRPVIRSCLDWTERRPHLAGSVGAALCAQFFERSWIRRAGRGRAVVLTPAGEEALLGLWNLDVRSAA